MTIRNRLCALLDRADVDSVSVRSGIDESWTSTSALNGSFDHDDLVSLFLHVLEDADRESCRVVRLRKKMRKMFFELEVTVNTSVRAYIGKIYSSDRGQAHFNALHRLRQAGFRPPSPFTVVAPVAYIDEHCLLLQEKAPGRPLADILSDENGAAPDALSHAAICLATLHSVEIDGHAPSRVEKVAAELTRYVGELAAALPLESARLHRLLPHALAALLNPHVTLVPSHGDFHSKNVYITDDGRVTLIDLDTFGQQERAADVAYFLAQTAIMGYHHHGSFVVSELHRDRFWNCYVDAARPIPDERLALYMAIAFLQSLHYELCVLRTANFEIVETWLGNIERFLIYGEVAILDDSASQSMRQPA